MADETKTPYQRTLTPDVQLILTDYLRAIAADPARNGTLSRQEVADYISEKTKSVVKDSHVRRWEKHITGLRMKIASTHPIHQAVRTVIEFRDKTIPAFEKKVLELCTLVGQLQGVVDGNQKTIAVLKQDIENLKKQRR